jgi:hypothetical protein
MINLTVTSSTPTTLKLSQAHSSPLKGSREKKDRLFVEDEDSTAPAYASYPPPGGGKFVKITKRTQFAAKTDDYLEGFNCCTSCHRTAAFCASVSFWRE